MTRPTQLIQVEWTEPFREAEQERRFKTGARAARQVAAILAAPDDVAKLRGVWVTSGFTEDRLAWTPVDPEALVAEHADAETATKSDLDDDGLTVAEWRERIEGAWRAHRQPEGKPA